jgi:apolipoprotein N-acyltransferase
MVFRVVGRSLDAGFEAGLEAGRARSRIGALGRSQLARGLALAVLSGMLYGAILPPASLHLVAWVALVPLFAASACLPAAGAALCGVAFGLAMSCSIASWLPGMLRAYFEIPSAVSWLGFAGIALRVALPYGLFAAWLAWMTRRGAPGPWLVACAFAVTEFARASGWVAVPFGLLGYSQAATPLAQTADLAGPYAPGALVAAVNAALAGGVTASLRGRHPLRHAASVALFVALGLLYGEWRLGQRFDLGKPIRVAVVQGGLPAARTQPEDGSAGLERYIELSASASAPDLVVWPEASLDTYPSELGAERHRLLAWAWSMGADLILGAPHYALGEAAETAYYNSVFLIREGELAGRYDKMRLVPFAEHDPLGLRLDLRRTRYSSGAAARSLDAGAARVGVFVCGELLFPSVARELAAGGAELLANPSDDSWFGAAAPAKVQLEAAAMRAIENRRYLLRATTTGYSAIIDPNGRIIAMSAPHVPAVLEGTVHASHAVTPYQRLGDAPIALAALLVAAASTRRIGPGRPRFHWRRT